MCVNVINFIISSLHRYCTLRHISSYNFAEDELRRWQNIHKVHVTNILRINLSFYTILHYKIMIKRYFLSIHLWGALRGSLELF